MNIIYESPSELVQELWHLLFILLVQTVQWVVLNGQVSMR